MLEFKNEATAKSYEALTDQDHVVTKAGLYSGKLSNITPEMAEAMIQQGSNLVREALVSQPSEEESQNTESFIPDIETNPEGAAQPDEHNDPPGAFTIE